MQFCMWLDADDVIEPEDRERFRRLKESLSPDTDMVMLRYHTAFDETGSPCFTYYRERLIRRDAGFFWQGAIHEAIAPAGNVIYSEAAVSHRKTDPGDPDRNLRIFQRLLREKGTLAPREQFYYARELTAHGRDTEAVAVLEEFLDSGEGWVENEIEACRDLSACFQRLNEPEKSCSALLRSLRFGPPRAEVCCDLGAFFFDRADFSTAAYWYRQALGCSRRDTGGGFVIPDCYGYLPCLQLCVCLYRLGDLKGAEEYNQKAGTFKPNSPAYLYNKAFFESRSAADG